MLAIRVSDEIEKKLTHIAEATERPKSFHIRKALEAYIDDQEDYLLALATKKNIQAKQEKTFSMEEVEALLNKRNA